MSVSLKTGETWITGIPSNSIGTVAITKSCFSGLISDNLDAEKTSLISKFEKLPASLARKNWDVPNPVMQTNVAVNFWCCFCFILSIDVPIWNVIKPISSSVGLNPYLTVNFDIKKDAISYS